MNSETSSSADHMLTLLAAPPDRLCPLHWTAGIRRAGALGRILAEQLLSPVPEVVADGRPLLFRREAYLDLVLRPWVADGSVSRSDFRRWERRFADGTALSDPRVQAFGAGCAQRTLEITASVTERRNLLARYFEVSVEEVEIASISRGVLPAFRYEGRHVLPLTANEARTLARPEIRSLLEVGRPSSADPGRSFGSRSFCGYEIFELPAPEAS